MLNTCLNRMLEKQYPKHIQQLKEQYNQLLANSQFDTVVIGSGFLKYPFMDDAALPFKVSPYFAQWLPITNNQNCFIIFNQGDQKPKLAFYIPKDFWHKTATIPDSYWVSHFDITIVSNHEEIHHLLPETNKHVAYIGEYDKSIHTNWSVTQNPDNFINPLNFSRAIKTEYELTCMREANRLALLGHQAAERAFFEKKSSLGIHLDYLNAIGHKEEQLPYQNIIGINENAAILHYFDISDQVEEQRHSMMIDAGATFNGYAADISRTYSYSSSEYQALIDAMDELQQKISNDLQAGKSYSDYHIQCHYHIAELLRHFNFTSLSKDTLVEKGITRVFFPHGLGHLLGLQVHDVGGQQASPNGGINSATEGFNVRCTRTLESGTVLTVEPGLYFIDMLLDGIRDNREINWNKVEQFKKYGGIRIEDNVIITKDGIENMTRDIQKSLSI